jgi:hypothetical protein
LVWPVTVSYRCSYILINVINVTWFIV